MLEPGAQLPLIAEVGPLVVSTEVFCAFELLGPPVAKARPRARMVFPRSKPPFVHFYQAGESEQYEQALGYVARAAMRSRAPTDRPVALLMHCFIAVPPSWRPRLRSDALAGALLPASKPDADNFLKIVDGLNGVVWIDDAQVVDARVIKRYSARPALRIEVREMIAPSALQARVFP